MGQRTEMLPLVSLLYRKHGDELSVGAVLQDKNV